jgi:hypothetical protein
MREPVHTLVTLNPAGGALGDTAQKASVPGRGRPNGLFHKTPARLDRVEVVAIGRYDHDRRPAFFSQQVRPTVFVGRQVVHHHDVSDVQPEARRRPTRVTNWFTSMPDRTVLIVIQSDAWTARRKLERWTRRYGPVVGPSQLVRGAVGVGGDHLLRHAGQDGQLPGGGNRRDVDPPARVAGRRRPLPTRVVADPRTAREGAHSAPRRISSEVAPGPDAGAPGPRRGHSHRRGRRGRGLRRRHGAANRVGPAALSVRARCLPDADGLAGAPRIVYGGRTGKRLQEQQFQELKTELGLDHFEGRTLPGWQHHVVITAIACAFWERQRMLGHDPLTLPPARAIVQGVFTGLLMIARPKYMKWLDQARQMQPLRI